MDIPLSTGNRPRLSRRLLRSLIWNFKNCPFCRTALPNRTSSRRASGNRSLQPCLGAPLQSGPASQLTDEPPWRGRPSKGVRALIADYRNVSPLAIRRPTGKDLHYISEAIAGVERLSSKIPCSCHHAGRQHFLLRHKPRLFRSIKGREFVIEFAPAPIASMKPITKPISTFRSIWTLLYVFSVCANTNLRQPRAVKNTIRRQRLGSAVGG